jgi:alkylation response protein AidB-like acyl-CoA dehydrogenase
MGAGLISEVADEELQQKILPGIGNGDIIVTLAADQIGNAWDAAGVKPMAEKQGDGYIINGTQSFVPFAWASDYIICCAEVNGLNNAGVTLFLLENKAEGMTCTPMPSFSIDKYYQVSLKGVKVTDDHVIGTPGQGRQAIEALWPKIIAGVCIMMVGGLQRVLELTVDYVKKRKQFGVPIGSFQAIQFYCADMAMDVESSKFIAYQAAWKASNHLAGKMDVSISKAWCGDAFQRVTALAHQSHGAIGFTEEYDLHFYYKQAKSLQLMYGGSPCHRQIVANEMDLIKGNPSGLT